MTNFEQEFGNRKIGFLIRKFEAREDRDKLVSTVRETFRQRGFTLKDASDKTLHSETWGNVKEYLENCSFGVVIIDNLSPSTTGFNPNVFLEIGYLLALKKDIFILLQNSLASTLPTDIKPFIYTSFDSLDIESSRLIKEINKWIDSTINYNPGYLAMYFKGEFINMDVISELKEIALAISDCSIIEQSKLFKPENKELVDLNIGNEKKVIKLVLKTQTKTMAESFVSDFNNGLYKNIQHITQSTLYIKIEKIFISEEYIEGGQNYVFNNDKEALVYCENEGIENCREEELYAYNFFKNKKATKFSDIEIVILPKFNQPNTFLYISNFVRQSDRHNVKMCHYPKDSSRIVLPMNTVDILYLIVHGCLVSHDHIKTNPVNRKLYLDVVDLHLDKVTYNIENRIPIETGLAKNIKYFNFHDLKK